MTTITSNGYYLIADKSCTTTRHKNTGNKAAMSYTADVYKTIDNVKIHVVSEGEYTYRGQRLLAYAVSGQANAGERFMRAAEGIPLESFVVAYNNIINGVNSDENFNVIAITNLHETLVFEVYGMVKDLASTSTIDMRRYAPGQCVGSGSGHTLTNALVDSNSLNLDLAARTHILHHHLFAACSDPKYSSIGYDVYGGQEGKLVTDLNPEPEAVLDSFCIVKNLIDIKPLALRD